MADPVITPEAPPKTGLIDSIEKMSGDIFSRPPAEFTLKETEAAKRVAEGKSGDQPAKLPDKVPDKAPEPVHEDELVIDGLKVEQPDEIKSEKGRKSWKMYKETVSKKITEYEKRIKDMESKVTSPNPEALKQYETKLADLQKERDDLNERLGRATLEGTPEFQRHYVKRASDVLADVKTAVGEKNAERVSAILQMPEGTIRNAHLVEIMADLDELQKSELSLAVKELRQIDKEKKEQVEKWKDGLTKREQILKAQQEAGIQQYSKIFDSTLSDLRKEQPLFAPKDGDQAWTDRATKMAEAAKELYMGKGTPEERARASMYGAFSSVLIETLRVQNEEMGKMTKQLEALRGKQPVINGGGTETSTGSAPPPGGKAESMIDRVARMAKEQGFVK